MLPVFFCAENAKWPRWEMQRRSLSTSRRAIQPRKCTGAPRALLTCHCEERSDVAISQNTAGQLGSHRQNRNCLPEIATSACGLLAMTNLGADAIFNASLYQTEVLRRARLSAPLLWRVRSAGVPQNLQPAWRSVTTATDRHRPGGDTAGPGTVFDYLTMIFPSAKSVITQPPAGNW